MSSGGETSIYQQCVAIWDDGKADTLLECVADSLQKLQLQIGSSTTEDGTPVYIETGMKSSNNVDIGVDFLFVLAGSLVFFMQTGFAMICAGCVRKKNAQNTMLKNLLDACGAAVAFFTVGYAFAFGGQDEITGTTFIGTKNFFNIGVDEKLGFWFFQYTFSAAAVTIVAGTLAERCQMTAYLLYSMFLAGFVYPVVCHSIWSRNGFLSSSNENPLLGVGMIDFAGSGVVHLTGGSTALFATYILGSRRGRFFDINTGKPLSVPVKIKGHSFALQLLGTMCLWFGWYGFNAGSALVLNNEFMGEVAARAAVNSSLAASGGGISALFVNLFLEERRTGEYNFDLQFAMNGCLSGLVAITAGCGLFEAWAALLVGIISGLLYIAGSTALVKARIDDAVDAIPVHMVNGVWGVISVGLFSAPGITYKVVGSDDHVGFFYSLGRGSVDASLLGCQVIGVIFIFAWTFSLMVPFFLWLNFMGWFRTESIEEIVGLDRSYHGRSAYSENYDDEEEIKNEYLDAYEQYKNNMRGRSNSIGAEDTSNHGGTYSTIPIPEETPREPDANNRDNKEPKDNGRGNNNREIEEDI